MYGQGILSSQSRWSLKTWYFSRLLYARLPLLSFHFKQTFTSFKDLIKIFRCRWTTACIDSPGYSPKTFHQKWVELLLVASLFFFYQCCSLMTARLVATSVFSLNRSQHRRFLGIIVGSRFTFTDRETDKNTNSQDCWEFWRMRRQCVPGSLSPPPESEPGFEARGEGARWVH